MQLKKIIHGAEDEIKTNMEEEVFVIKIELGLFNPVHWKSVRQADGQVGPRQTRHEWLLDPNDLGLATGSDVHEHAGVEWHLLW